MKKFNLKRVASLIYALAITAMAFLFFTNDFGLVDIRKTAVIIGAGIDLTESGVSVIAQVAVPQATENGGSTQYIEVEGEGVTVGDALNVINKKTGFFPKLVFCKLLILGESCSRGNIFEILDYFYRDDFTQLTPLVAMCKGSAGELLASKMRFGNTATVSIERLLSEEAKKSGNVSTVNLKIIGIHDYSPSKACYMPFITAQEQSAEGSSQSTEGGGEGGGEGQEGSSQGNSTPSSGGNREFLCDKTAIFSDGRLAGVLDEEQTFALNILKNNVRHIFVPCTAEGRAYTLGMRSCRGSVGVSVEGDVPQINASFSAVVQISDSEGARPEEVSQGVVPQSVLAGGERAIREMFLSLIEALRSADCDALGLRTLLYRFNYSGYEQFKGDVLSGSRVAIDIDLRSAG